MKILQVHNQYSSGIGGEDIVVETERNFLVEHGCKVEQYLTNNSEINIKTVGKVLRWGIQSIWAFNHYVAIKKYIKEFKPDIIHVHNTFAVLSPSIFWAIKSEHVPCVITLHNYRLICPAATLFRDGRLCEECVGHFPYPAIKHRCQYNGSFLPVAVNAVSQVIHRSIGTYYRNIDAIIVLNPFFAQIMQRSGFSINKIKIKNNSVVDLYDKFGDYITRQKQIVYIGQITSGKGIDFLLTTWATLKVHQYQLIIIGDGLDKVNLQERFSRQSDITWLGRIDHKLVLEVVRQSRFLVLPSIWNEPFGLSAVEALMMATPVIVPDHIALAKYVENAGYIYDNNDEESFSRVLELSIHVDQNNWDQMSRNARRAYIKDFTPKKDFTNLIEIYKKAIKVST